MIRDHGPGGGTTLECDVCIVGAGPAGLALAERLEGSGLRVLVLESGALRAVSRPQRLNDGPVLGHPYRPLMSARNRSFGGSANRWGGWCRPLDPWDFEARSWVPGTGWPIAYADMARYHDDASRFLFLPEDPFTTAPAPDPPGFVRDAGFENAGYQISPLKRAMREGYDEAFAGFLDTTVVLRSTVVDIRLAPGTSRVGHLEVAYADGTRWGVRPTACVLAAGGLENARLLLLAQQDRPSGLGNEHDQVGRYFMEHVHADVGHLVTDQAALLDDWYTALGAGVPGRSCGALAGDVATQQREQLLPISLALTVPPQQRQPWSRVVPPEIEAPLSRATRALMPKRPQRPSADAPEATPHDASQALRTATRLVRGFGHDVTVAAMLPRLRHQVGAQALRSGTVRGLYVRSEQVPNPSSRVRLTDRRDSLGQRRLGLDWRLTDLDLDNVDSWLARLQQAVLGVPGTSLALDPRWRRHVVGGPHHAGTTRMSASPRDGVVDAQSRVHSVDNLFVAGSSVFATGGYANPTYPLVALALRLGDHLRGLGLRRVALPEHRVTELPDAAAGI